MVTMTEYNHRDVFNNGSRRIVEIDAPWGKPWSYFSCAISTDFPGAAVLPVTDEGHVVMVHQVRPAIGAALTTEIPRGGAEPGETWQECAVRELWEETNLVPSEVHFLGRVAPDNGCLDGLVPVFFARVPEPDLTFVSDETHLSLLTLDELKASLVSGDINDSFTSYALVMAQLKGLLKL